MSNRVIPSFFFLCIGVIIISGCVQTPQSSRPMLDQIASVGLTIHDHWTNNDVNDGKIVYVDLINKRNVALGKYDTANIQNLKVKLRILGYDTSTKDYTIENSE